MEDTPVSLSFGTKIALLEHYMSTFVKLLIYVLPLFFGLPAYAIIVTCASNFEDSFLQNSGVSVNIYLGTEYIGFGDIATNLIMAKKLVHDLGLSNVNVIVNNGYENHDRLKILEPRFLSKAKPQVIDGITFYSKEVSDVPKSSIGISFSLNHSQAFHDRPFKRRGDQSSDFHMMFDEYGGPKSRTNKYFESWGGYFSKSDIRSVAGLESGVEGLGLYISKLRPPLARLKRQILEDATSVSGVKMSFDNPLLGFSYTSGFLATLAYLTGIKDSKLLERAQEIVLVVKKFNDIDYDSFQSQKLKIIPYDQLPLNLSEELIAHSDLPIMVTGDISLTMALEYEKIFFYESVFGKEYVLRGLLNFVLDNSNALEHPSQVKLLEKIWSLKGKIDQNIKVITYVLDHRKIVDEVSKTIHENRLKISLVDKLGRIIVYYLKNGFGSELTKYIQSLYNK